MKEGGGAAAAAATTPPAPATNGSGNPFFRSETVPPPVAPAPPKSPGIPPPVKTTYHTAPKDSDDDWDEVVEKEDDDSSDEELGTRDTRMDIAQRLFGTLLPSRPQSAGPAPQSTGSPVSPASPTPPAPAPPVAPAAPSALVTAPVPTGNRGALLSAIQGGARLRKAVTKDRSAAALSGKVIGDTAPPSHINAAPRPASPPSPPPESISLSPAPFTIPPPPAQPPAAPLMGPESSSGHGKRESVDWYNGLAADVDRKELNHLPATAEEDEEEQASAGGVPEIQVSEHAAGDAGSELMDDVDTSTGESFYIELCRSSPGNS